MVGADFNAVLVSVAVTAKRVIWADVHDVGVVHAVKEAGVGEKCRLMSTED
jgi:hypothetical protein